MILAEAQHPEVPVKVTAWIDEAVAPLVVALNDFTRVVTLDSCQGSGDTGAYVLFRLRGDAPEASRFASDLARALSEEHALEYMLQAEWRPGGEGQPLLSLTCPQTEVASLATALNACRMRLSAYGS